jgi:hypothetical protein
VKDSTYGRKRVTLEVARSPVEVQMTLALNTEWKDLAVGKLAAGSFQHNDHVLIGERTGGVTHDCS